MAHPAPDRGPTGGRPGQAVPLAATASGARPAGAAGLAALSRVHAAALAAILVLGAAVRLYGLGAWPFEHDEAFTYFRARDLEDPSARPFYFLIHHAVLAVLPHAPLYQRLPSLVFGVLGVWATWALGRHAFGPVAGLAAAYLVAISPWHLYFSQFARYWSLIYLIATLLYRVLPDVADTDRRGAHLAALALILTGALTHPTLLFPLPGFLYALHRVRRSGEPGWRPPSRRALRLLWGPLAALALAAFTALALTGNLGALRNGDSRGLAETLRLVPAIVEWTGPVIAAAAAAGGVWLLAYRPADRRWAAMALLGGASSLLLLLVASLVTAVYSDYGMAILPLVAVTAGGAVQRVAESLEGRGASAVPAAALAVLSAGVLPSTVSHFSDGTRHDPRPAYAYVAAELARGRRAPVYGPAPELQRFHAPALPMRRLGHNPARLDRALREAGGLWLIAFYRREGMVLASDRVDAWVRAHCHSVLRTHHPRLDYRIYRVELHWCGHGTGAAGAPRR